MGTDASETTHPKESSLISTLSSTGEEVPVAFLNVCQGNMKKAKAKWEATKRWRADNKIGE